MPKLLRTAKKNWASLSLFRQRRENAIWARAEAIMRTSATLAKARSKVERRKARIRQYNHSQITQGETN